MIEKDTLKPYILYTIEKKNLNQHIVRYDINKLLIIYI